MNLSEIIKRIQILKKSMSIDYKVGILSNITINQLKHYLEFDLRINNIGCECIFGDYDNILQKQKNFQTLIVILFFGSYLTYFRAPII